MENQVTNQLIKTDRTGSIEGRKVTIVYENKAGESPVIVNGVCNIPDATDPMRNTNITVNVNNAGHKNIQVNGGASSEEVFAIITGIEAEISAILNAPTV